MNNTIIKLSDSVSIIDNENLINDSNIEELKRKIANQSIYWSDSRCEHYIFDFKFNNKFWIESKNISNDFNKIVLNAYS